MTESPLPATRSASGSLSASGVHWWAAVRALFTATSSSSMVTMIAAHVSVAAYAERRTERDMHSAQQFIDGLHSHLVAVAGHGRLNRSTGQHHGNQECPWQTS